MKTNKFYTALVLGVLTIGLAGWSLNKNSKTNTSSNHSTKALASLEKPETATIQLKDVDGNPVNFSDFKGKIVFVNNWATWCRPCTMEMPSIQKLKEEFKGEGLAFVMISYDQSLQTSVQWMQNKGYTLPIYTRGKDLPQKFITRGIPATFILNKKGEVVYKHIGMSDYSSPNFIEQMKGWLAE